MSLSIHFQSIVEFGLESACEVLNQGFSDYFLPIQLTTTSLLHMVGVDSVDLSLSKVVILGDQPVGVALIARRGWSSRLAAMCVVPAARGRGLGEACVRVLLSEAQERRDRKMMLEVIQTNKAALMLYGKCGFHITRALVGYTCQDEVKDVGISLEETDIRDAARMLSFYGPADLPWQLSGETLAHTGPPSVAFKADGAWIVLSDPVESTIIVRALLTLPEYRRHGHATRLLHGVMTHFTDKTWRVPAIWPEETSALFEKSGWKRASIAQWQMEISF